MAALVTVACSGSLFAAEKATDEYRAEKQRIEADAKAAREKCKDMKGNEKDVCAAQAKGQERIAKAELALKQSDTPKNRYDLAVAKAEMEYNVAKERCDEMKGKDKDACQKQARSARDSARKTAKGERDAAEPRKEAKARKDA